MSYETVLLPKFSPDETIILAKEQFHNSYTFWAMPILIFSRVQIIITHPLFYRPWLYLQDLHPFYLVCSIQILWESLLPCSTKHIDLVYHKFFDWRILNCASKVGDFGVEMKVDSQVGWTIHKLHRPDNCKLILFLWYQLVLVILMTKEKLPCQSKGQLYI